MKIRMVVVTTAVGATLAGAIGATATPAAAQHTSRGLRVAVNGLPATTPVDIEISGPKQKRGAKHRYHRTVRGATTIKRLTPGMYTVTVHPVTTPNGTATATLTRFKVKVHERGVAAVTVNYSTPPPPVVDPVITPDGSACAIGPGADLSGCDLSNRDLTNVDLTGAKLVGANLTRTTLSRALLANADLTGANLQGAILNSAMMQNVNLTNANLAGAAMFNPYLVGAELTGAKLAGVQGGGIRGVDLRGVPASLPAGWFIVRDALICPGAQVSGTDFTGVDLHGADLTGLSAAGTDFSNANLRGANLHGAFLAESQFQGADLTGANLKFATLRDTKMVGATLNQVQSGSIVGYPKLDRNIQVWKGYVLAPGVDLAGVDLSQPKYYRFTIRADLSGANLTNVKLSNTEFDGANLDGTQLAGANVERFGGGTNVSGTPASLPDRWEVRDRTLLGPGVSLTNADLRGANLDGVDLTGGALGKSDITGASFRNATLDDFSFGSDVIANNIDFTGVHAHNLYVDYLRVEMDGANFAGADLKDSRIDLQTMKDVDFTDADLTNAIIQANLTGVNFTRANLTNTYLWARMAGVVSSGIIGTPARVWSEPAPPWWPGWVLVDGTFVQID